MNKISITIGNEYDEVLIALLKQALKDLKAVKIYENSELAGSQDFYSANFNINSSTLTVEIETYIGITLIGSPKLIEEIKHRIDLLKQHK